METRKGRGADTQKMMLNMASVSHLIDLINSLLKKGESQWLEFKHNKADPEYIGKVCSALSNSALLAGRDKGYVIWGVDDGTHGIVGTSFNPDTTKKGNQLLRSWLANMLSPCPQLEFQRERHPQGDVVLLEVSAAMGIPTTFRGQTYIRIGSDIQNLQKHPQEHRKLISRLNEFNWEEAIAKEHQSQDEVLDLLDWKRYFQLLKESIPSNPTAACERLSSEGLIRENDAGRWDITNLGAILFAGDLSRFGNSLGRKGIRLAVYPGDNKAEKSVERVDGIRGYALAVENVLNHIYRYIPVSGQIGEILREDTPLFPKLSIRELLVNALVHQDFTITGAGPNIYVFKSRLEIENPGESLILPPERMIDSPPRSRNQALSGLMRRMGFSEEQGSGLNKVISEIESLKSPPPDFYVGNGATRVTLFGPRPFARMTATERVRACYQHAVIMKLSDKKMTNATLRERLGMQEGSSSSKTQASAIIKAALEQNLIKPADPEHPRSNYVPAWA